MLRVLLLFSAMMLLSVDALPGYSTIYEMMFGRPGCSNGCGPFTCCSPAPSCSFVQPIDFDVWEFSPYMYVVFSAATAEVYKIDNICYSFIVNDAKDSAFSGSITYEDGTGNIKTFGTSRTFENVYKAEGGPCKFDFEVTGVVQEMECLLNPIYIVNRCFCNEWCSDDSMVIGLSNDPHVDARCISKAIDLASRQFPCFLFRTMPNLLMPACVPPVNIIADLPMSNL